MARKSRTQPKQSPDTLNVLSKVYKTAIYVRLSAEKDETRDRKTLINQRNLIKNFVDQQMDMEIHDIYMDDEISGTTFDRPEFERMSNAWTRNFYVITRGCLHKYIRGIKNGIFPN